MLRNYIIQEAVENGTFNPTPFVSAYKKSMNLCKLTKFKSIGECAKFYSAFFLCNVDVTDGAKPTFHDWMVVYNTLLSDVKFCNDLCYFMAMYSPADFTGMWNPLINLIDFEMKSMQKYRVKYLADAKAFFRSMQQSMDSIGETIKTQINDPQALKFVITVNGTLSTHIFYIDRLMQREVSTVSPDDIMVAVRRPLEEDVQEILNLLENYDTEIQKFMDPLDEAVLKNAVMKAKELKIKADKAARAFDEFIMKKVKAAREKRRNRKHAEMVGEALRINNELKRLLKSCAVGVFSPALGVILWVTSVVVDRQTDKRDRDILVGQIKDELEIVEEKIAMAERNGDDKAKIELIRIRQRLKKEYERIMKYKWDPSRLEN